MAKAKKAVVIKKKHKVQAQPKIVQPEDKKVKPKVEKAKPEIIQPKKQEAEWVIGVDPYGKRYGGENKLPEGIITNEQQLNVSEMTIKEIMIQKGLSYEGAISFLKANQSK